MRNTACMLKQNHRLWNSKLKEIYSIKLRRNASFPLSAKITLIKFSHVIICNNFFYIKRRDQIFISSNTYKISTLIVIQIYSVYCPDLWKYLLYVASRVYLST